MDYEQQIRLLWEEISALKHEVNNVLKNENGNINNKTIENKTEIDEHSDAIDDIIIAITPSEVNENV